MFTPRSGSEESRKRSKPALTPVREVRRRLGNCPIETNYYLRALRLHARETQWKPSGSLVKGRARTRCRMSSSTATTLTPSTSAPVSPCSRVSTPHCRARPRRWQALATRSTAVSQIAPRSPVRAPLPKPVLCGARLACVPASRPLRVDSCTPLSGSRCPPLPAVRPSVQNVSPAATGVSASIIEFCTHSLLPHIPSPSRSVLHQGPLGRAEAMPETRTPSIACAETESNGGQTAIRPRSGLLAPSRRRALEYLTPRTDAHSERRSDALHDACTGAKTP